MTRPKGKTVRGAESRGRRAFFVEISPVIFDELNAAVAWHKHRGRTMSRRMICEGALARYLERMRTRDNGGKVFR